MTLKQYLLGKVDAKRTARDWSKLPASFEHDAVRWVFEMWVKRALDRRDIAVRVKASQAVTFQQLDKAINAMKFDVEMAGE